MSVILLPKSKKLIKKERKGFARNRKPFRHKNTKIKKSLFYLFLFVSSILFISLIIYLSIISIIKIRENVNKDEIQNTPVVGFEELPSFPASEYIFKSTSSSEYSKELINNGYSVYRLSKDSTFNEVISFYDEELPKKGFEKVNSFPIRTETNIEGEYWIKEGKGYHIYSRINDIWYERISVNEAKDGLSKKAKEISSRNELLFTSGNQSFLPNYPWRSNIPGNAVITYSNTQFTDLQNVNISIPDLNITTKIEIVGIYSGGILDDYLNRYAQENNILINSTSLEFVYDSASINFDGTINSTTTIGFLFIHPQSGYVYIMYNIGEKREMYDYIKSYLQPALK